jgi:hypothetical protein
MPAFRAAFSLMQVQGNQIASVCLEQKQSCMRTEQRSQLTRKVPHRLCAGLRKTRRGRLCTASARRTWQAGKKLWQAALEPTRVIAEETRKQSPRRLRLRARGKRCGQCCNLWFSCRAQAFSPKCIASILTLLLRWLLMNQLTCEDYQVFLRPRAIIASPALAHFRSSHA